MSQSRDQYAKGKELVVDMLQNVQVGAQTSLVINVPYQTLVYCAQKWYEQGVIDQRDNARALERTRAEERSKASRERLASSVNKMPVQADQERFDRLEIGDEKMPEEEFN